MKVGLAEVRKMIKWPDFLRWQKERSLSYNLTWLPLRFMGAYILIALLASSPVIVYGNIEFLLRDRITLDNTNNQTTIRLAQLAKSGDPQAMSSLADLFQSGTGDLSKDCVQALRWHEKAARLGVKKSQLALAYAHFRGKGVLHDETRAYYWAKYATRGDVVEGRFSYMLRKLENSLSEQDKLNWINFRPADEPPTWIYDGPFLAGLERQIFLPFESCRI